MRYLTLSSMALIMVLMLGCIPVSSLQPLYTDDNLIFNPEIVGTWIEDDGDSWIFQKSEKNDKAYRLTVTEDEDSLNFQVHMLKLDKYTFLDIYPEGLNKILFIPAHAIFRVTLEGDSLGLSFLDDNWVEENIENNTIEIRHEYYGDDEILLTASTQELQEFVIKHAEDKEAFTDWYLKRKSNK